MACDMDGAKPMEVAPSSDIKGKSSMDVKEVGVNYGTLSHKELILRVPCERREEGKVGECVSSPVLTHGALKWKVCCYPRGYSEECGEHVSFSVQLISCSDPIEVLVNIAAVGAEPSILVQSLQTFSSKEPNVFFPTLIAKNDWESKYMVERSVRFSISLALLRGAKSAVHPDIVIGSDVAQLLGDRQTADLVLVAGERQFYVHKVVLAARSHRLRVELFRSNGESDPHYFQGVDPIAIEAFLFFLYNDTLPHFLCSASSLQNLISLAQNYGMQQLIRLCEEMLANELQRETVISYLGYASENKLPYLTQQCLEYIFVPQRVGLVMDDRCQALLGKYPELKGVFNSKFEELGTRYQAVSNDLTGTPVVNTSHKQVRQQMRLGFLHSCTKTISPENEPKRV